MDAPPLLDDLGRHRRRSRVIWYPGSTPPYSSLWITIQRFLMLNQPTRAAFRQDFLLRQVSGESGSGAHATARRSLNDYQLASDQDPVRLTRLRRVLKEDTEAFRCCHIGQIPTLARPYFGDFAVCPYCLAEGFHSILYSFDGIGVCPVHGSRLESRSQPDKLSSDFFNSALRNPFGGCQYLQQVLDFPAARTPKAHAHRDLVLGEVANWLMNVGSRCWLGQLGVRDAAPFERFTTRLTHLKQILNLPDATPKWANADVRAMIGSPNAEVAKFGGVKVYKNDLVDIDDRRALRHQTELSIYGQTTFGDFKAIRRYLKRRALGKRGRYWLARIGRATSTEAVKNMLAQGEAHARQAWLFLAWSRQIHDLDFSQKSGLHTRPMRLALSLDFPLSVANSGRNSASAVHHDFVRQWIARWISGAGLLAFWRSVSGVAEDELSPDISVLDKMLREMRTEPQWGLGISANNELILCLERSN